MRAGALCFPILLGIVAACSDDPASADDTFSLALTIEGSGQVTSTPSGIDCTAPADCGSTSFAADASVELTATPATGFTLAKIAVDGTTSTDGIVRGAAGASEKVVVTFVATGTGGPGTSLDGGDSADAGMSTDGGDGGGGALGSACTTPDGCGTSAVCCVHLFPSLVPTRSGVCETAAQCSARHDDGSYGTAMCSGTPDVHCPAGSTCSTEGEERYGVCQGPPR